MSGLKSPKIYGQKTSKIPRNSESDKEELNDFMVWVLREKKWKGQKKTLADHDLFRSESPFKQLGYMLYYYVVIIQSFQVYTKAYLGFPTIFLL